MTPATRRVHAVIRQAKMEPTSWRTAIAVPLNGHLGARLDPVTTADAEVDVLVDLLASWRQAASESLPACSPITRATTRNWLLQDVLERPDSLLFWIRGDHDGAGLGTIGLCKLDSGRGSMELDHFIRGRRGILPGIVEASVRVLLDWTALHLGLATLSLRVGADNDRAVRLADRCGFVVTREISHGRASEGRRVLVMERPCGPRRAVSARVAA